jgi:polysaccharide export outer membrane protein
VPDNYQIGAGDVLQISVWKEPEASVPTVVVRPDGRISIPLVKEVEVLGLTPRGAEALITSKLSEFIRGVDVTVIVTTINSKKVYVVGAAKKEGPLAYTYRMTVLQAITEAGGLTDYAKRKKIYVLHSDQGKDYRLPFDYDEVVKGEKTEQNIHLSPGDTVFIPH